MHNHTGKPASSATSCHFNEMLWICIVSQIFMATPMDPFQLQAAIQYCPNKRYMFLYNDFLILFQNFASGGATSMHHRLFVPKERSGRFSPKHPAPELGSKEICPAVLENKCTRMIAGATNPTHLCLAWKSKTKQRMVFRIVHVKDSLPMGKPFGRLRLPGFNDENTQGPRLINRFRKPRWVKHSECWPFQV